jgi:hypothetical protein
VKGQQQLLCPRCVAHALNTAHGAQDSGHQTQRWRARAAVEQAAVCSFVCARTVQGGGGANVHGSSDSRTMDDQASHHAEDVTPCGPTTPTDQRATHKHQQHPSHHPTPHDAHGIQWECAPGQVQHRKGGRRRASSQGGQSRHRTQNGFADHAVNTRVCTVSRKTVSVTGSWFT